MRILLAIGFWICTAAHAQDIVPSQGITSAFHQENISRIFFTAKALPRDQLGANAFLQHYTLTPNSDLFFAAFFSNSLTNLKHRLAPGMTRDSLFRKGNYQFSILIDGKEIYRSNLLPGAPQQRQQDTTTVLYRPLIDNKNGQGSWSESFWNRFMNAGGSRVLTDGPHLLRMEIRPYIQGNALQVGELMASGEMPITVALHPVIDVRKVELHRPKPYPGLQVSTSGFDTVRMKQLKGSIDSGLFRKISSVIILKEGRILLEEYFNGAQRETLHDTRSVGKSFASTLTGMAIEDGYIRNEELTLNEVYAMNDFAQASEAKGATTLKDLLTMASGFDGDDGNDASPGNEENMYPTENWVKFALDLPFDTTYKKQWHYFTAGVVVLGDVLQRRVKGGLEAYAQRKLFSPLGIKQYQWQYTPQKVPNTAGGLQLRALDLAKFGQLYKDKGSWQGKQLIAENWINKTLTPYHALPGRPGEYYGYLFWQKTFAVNDRNFVVDYCSGNGGNYVMIFRDLPLVVVITATAYGQPYAHPQVHRMLTEFLIPAILE